MTHSPSFDAAIRRLETCEKAARNMLIALRQVRSCPQAAPWLVRDGTMELVMQAIEQAEKAGLESE